jgi:cytochrome c oxidase cbb3-type subunit III
MKKIILGLSFFIIVILIIAIGSSKDNTQNAYAQEGEKMYAQMCAACHGETGLGEGEFSGTALNNQQFLSSVSDEDIFNYIKFGRVEALMPEYGSVLEDEEINKLTAYVRDWQHKDIKFEVPDKIEGDPEKGKNLYGLYCLSCHGESGQGKKAMGTALGNPDYLKHTTDEQIWIATAYGRDETRMGPSLKGLEGVRQLKKQDISDIISYIRDLQSTQ